MTIFNFPSLLLSQWRAYKQVRTQYQQTFGQNNDMNIIWMGKNRSCIINKSLQMFFFLVLDLKNKGKVFVSNLWGFYCGNYDFSADWIWTISNLTNRKFLRKNSHSGFPFVTNKRNCTINRNINCYLFLFFSYITRFSLLLFLNLNAICNTNKERKIFFHLRQDFHCKSRFNGICRKYVWVMMVVIKQRKAFTDYFLSLPFLRWWIKVSTLYCTLWIADERKYY